MTLRVAIVEDQAAVRDTLVACLRGVDGIDVARVASSLADARARLAAPADVVLLDLGLPDGRGTALMPLLRQRVPSPAVVAFTVFGDEASVVEAIAAGVDGYVPKAASADVLVDAVRGAAAGESPISPAVAGYLLRRVRGAVAQSAPRSPVDPLLALTPRELDVLQALARGLSYREATARLEISPGTVAHHVTKLYPKLAAGSRAEAVFRAVQQGLVRLGKP